MKCDSVCGYLIIAYSKKKETLLRETIGVGLLFFILNLFFKFIYLAEDQICQARKTACCFIILFLLIVRA